jgi:UDP-2,4-diacetamido-2,4,6-trideoxy-beta-L-altropyranose hydrolase
VAKLLHQSRFAIISASTLAHEVLFMGVPFLAIKTADNQADMYHYLTALGHNTLACWSNEGFTQCIKKLIL